MFQKKRLASFEESNVGVDKELSDNVMLDFGHTSLSLSDVNCNAHSIKVTLKIFKLTSANQPCRTPIN